MTRRYILDSNILSQIIKPKASDSYIDRLRGLSEKNVQLLLSPMVYFEVKRGLLEIGATKQLKDLTVALMTLIS